MDWRLSKKLDVGSKAMLAAVAQNGWAVEQASAELRGGREVEMAAVEDGGTP